MRTRRLVVPVLAGAVVFGSVSAFAATLDVSSDGLAAGNVPVTACNATARVSYTTGYDAALAGYGVTTTPLTTAAGCAGKAFKITLLNGTAILKEVTGVLDGTGTLAPAVTGVKAADVTDVSVVITG